MYEAVEAFPLNFGFLGKGNGSGAAALREQIRAGALGLKLHEDWGSTPAAIDCCLTVADEFDVQVAIHTDTLNETGFVEDTIKAIAGRTIHTYHTEGAGGGHAPDIIRMCGEPNVLPSSTNPTMPFTRNTLDEHLDMLMVCHHLSPNVPEDVAFADSRIRPETMAAEDILHDIGAFSMMSSDSQAMGRIGEVICRTWQTADKMKRQRGPLPGESAGSDNLRVKRYIAKYTINPAITHGIAAHVGSIAVGKMADLVLWKPAFFGVKPELVIKGGFIAGAMMGDGNASIPTPQPVIARSMFGAYGAATQRLQRAFRQPGRYRRRQPRGPRPPARGRARLPGARQERPGAQRRPAAHRGRSGVLRSESRRRVAAVRAGRCAADGAAILPVLSGRMALYSRRHDATSRACWCDDAFRTETRKSERGRPGELPAVTRVQNHSCRGCDLSSRNACRMAPDVRPRHGSCSAGKIGRRPAAGASRTAASSSGRRCRAGGCLRAGDCLVVESARAVVEVVERPEPAFVIEPRTPQEWGLFAYHIGNGHQPLMVTDRALVCPDVPGVEMLLQYHRHSVRACRDRVYANHRRAGHVAHLAACAAGM